MDDIIEDDAEDTIFTSNDHSSPGDESSLGDYEEEKERSEEENWDDTILFGNSTFSLNNQAFFTVSNLVAAKFYRENTKGDVTFDIEHYTITVRLMSGIPHT